MGAFPTRESQLTSTAAGVPTVDVADVRGTRVKDQLDVALEDPELLAEVELVAALMAAANASETALSPVEIDRLLGLARIPGQAAREG